MEKKTTFSLIIPLLTIIVLLVSFVSILSYTKLISTNLSKATGVIDKNYELYHDVAIDNFDDSIGMSLSTLEYISIRRSDLIRENGGTEVDDFSCLHFENQNKALAPQGVKFLTREDISSIMDSLNAISDIYTAFDSILEDNTIPAVFFDSELSEPGYYILYPCSDASDYQAILAYYSPEYFLIQMMHCNVLNNGTYSIYSTSEDCLYTYDTTDNSVVPFKELIFATQYEKINSSNNITSSIRDDVMSKRKTDIDVRDTSDDSEYHIYYEPLHSDACDIINLYSFITIPNSFDFTYNIIDMLNDKGNSLALLLIGIFFIIIICIVALQTYYHNNYASDKRRLEMATKRYQSIIGFTKWLIWEYDYEKKELVFLSGEKEEPLPAEQYKNYLIREELIMHEDISAFDELLKQVISGNPNITATFRIRYGTTDYRWHEFTGHTINDISGKPVTVQVVAMDIDEQKKELEAAKNSSERDSLTGVLNLYALKEHTKGIIEDRTSSLMHAFVIVDFDNFKLINENYGQTFGDAILIEFTSKLSSLISANDMVGRVSADKFIIFLYNIPDITYTNEFVMDIFNMSLFENFTFEGDNSLKLTCSIGIAIYPNHANTFESLIGAVDIALYHAKKRGRNCCVMYEHSFSSTQTGNNLLSSIGKDSSNRINNATIDNELVFNVADMMFTQKDLNVSTTLALSLIGNYYGFDQVGIIEYNNVSARADCNYSWNSKNFERFSREILSVPKDIDSTIALYSTSKDGVYYTSKLDIYNLPATGITDILKCADIQSIFQCAMLDNGVVKGYLFAHSSHTIDWENSVADTITLITKIISGCIMKQHSDDDIQKLIRTDILTGSDNLTSFVSKANKLVEDNPHAPLAMIYLDINKFRLINDKYGYSIGDHVIISLANMIKNNLEDGELFARTDADKFLILLHFNGISKFDGRVMNLFNSFSTFIKNDVGCRASLIAGVYLMHDETDISASIDKANIARKSIKDHHNTTYEIFNESMKSSLVIKNDIEDAMDTALENGEFQVYYQPKMNIFTDKICGSEALVRWNRPNEGLISPDIFIPVFEDNGFIVNIDYYVFDKVCATLRRLMDEGFTVYPVSVNFSRVHLKSNKIIRRLEQTTKKYGIDPSLIEVEITESALSEGDDFTPTLLNAIKNLGFKLSMDDFGCGLSSLNSLRKFPFDILKLDKEFFNNDEIDEKEKIVVRNVVTLAKQLNMSIIAEGIETEDHLDFLRSIDCPVVQGYIYSKPLPEDEFIEKYLTYMSPSATPPRI